MDRDLRLQHFLEVPRDGLALAVLIRGEEEFVGLAQQLLELLDLLLLVRVDHVDGLEVVFDVHTEAAHLAGVLLRHLRGAVGKVADVPDARLDDVAGAQVALDRLRLGRRLDDDESAAALCGLAGRGQLRSSLRSAQWVSISRACAQGVGRHGDAAECDGTSRPRVKREKPATATRTVTRLVLFLPPGVGDGPARPERSGLPHLSGAPGPEPSGAGTRGPAGGVRGDAYGGVGGGTYGGVRGAVCDGGRGRRSAPRRGGVRRSAHRRVKQ